MKRLGKTLRILLIVFLLFALLLVYGWSRWQNIKHDLGLTINWQSVGLSFKGITFEQLTVSQVSADGTLITTNSQNVIVSFSNFDIDKLDIKVQRGNYITKPSEEASTLEIQTIIDSLSWLPKKTTIKSLTASLPCPKGQCLLTGQLALLRNNKPHFALSLDAVFDYNTQQLVINTDLHQNQQQLTLVVLANFNQQPLLSLNTEIDSQDLKNWQGKLNLYKVSNTPLLFAWLNEWLPDQQVITAIPAAAEIKADWQLSFPQGLTSFKAEHGYLKVNASLPNPLPITQLGYVQGLLNTQITLNNYRPKIEVLEANLQLTHINRNFLEKIPEELQPQSASIKIQPITTTDQSIDRAISLDLMTEGAINTSFSTHILINTRQQEVALANALFTANTDKFSLAGYRIEHGNVSLPFTALITPQQLTVTLDKSTKISAQQLNIVSQSIIAKNSLLAINSLNFIVNYNDKNNIQLLVNTPITLTMSSFNHPLLKPLSWKLTGQLKADLKQTSFTGKLSNGADLSADLSVLTDYDKKLTLNIKTPDLFFRTSNILAKTLQSWPSLLEIVTGKINLNGSLILALNNKPVNAKATVKFSGLAGIYDRTEFRDLTGTATLNLTNNTLKLSLPDLALTEANPGFNMGPMQFIGDYTANINKPLEGTLSWTKAELTLFTGDIWLKPGQLNLGTFPQSLDLQVKNLQLTDVLKAYPTEGLNGEGTIDGHLPIILSKTGVDIKDGQLTARQGGFFKFDSPAIKALGENNPSMQLVTDALENFQYTVLSSQVSYNKGIAILGLQIKGKNPDVKKGQAINLNVTLQEDIPALMTSLQLSDRVSEKIRERVQKRLQQGAGKNQ